MKIRLYIGGYEVKALRIIEILQDKFDKTGFLPKAGNRLLINGDADDVRNDGKEIMDLVNKVVFQFTEPLICFDEGRDEIILTTEIKENR